MAFELVSQGHWVMPLRQRMESVLLLPWIISPTPVVMGVANSLKCLGHFSQVWDTGGSFPLRVRASCLAAVSRKGQGHQRAGPVQHGPWISSCIVLWLHVVTGTTDIKMDSSCSRTMDSDMVLSSSSGSNVTMLPVADWVTQISMVSSNLSKALTPIWSQEADQTPDVHISLSGNRSHGEQLRFWLL